MKREDLEHIIRASGDVLGESEVIIVGSQAILGAPYEGLPKDVTLLVEVDVMATHDPTAARHFVSTVPLTGVTPTAITGVWPTSNSSYAFVTYSGTGGVLPAYAPVASQSGTATAGTLTNIPLSGTAVAPVGGVVSADNSTFYAGTSGDDLVHVISITGASPLTDTTTIAPVLPCGTSTEVTNPCTSGQSYAAPDLLVQKPRSST